MFGSKQKNITFYDVWLRQHLSMRLFSYFYPLSHRPLACGRVQALNIFKTLICYLHIIRPQRIATRYKWTKLAYLLIYLTLLVRHVSMFRAAEKSNRKQKVLSVKSRKTIKTCQFGLFGPVTRGPRRRPPKCSSWHYRGQAPQVLGHVGTLQCYHNGTSRYLVPAEDIWHVHARPLLIARPRQVGL